MAVRRFKTLREKKTSRAHYRKAARRGAFKEFLGTKSRVYQLDAQVKTRRHMPPKWMEIALVIETVRTYRIDENVFNLALEPQRPTVKWIDGNLFKKVGHHRL